MTLPPAVLWADPGMMTGIAMLYPCPVVDIPPEADPVEILPARKYTHEFWCDELPFFDAAYFIMNACRQFSSGLAIGWERFDINSETHKKTRAGTNDAMHMIGVCRYASMAYNCRAIEPAQQHTPNLEEQRQLKRLGWWLPGKNDAQSAAAHMLRWLIRSNELTPAQRTILYG